MSVNLNHAIPDNKRNKNYGKNYYAIDFERSDRLTAHDYGNQWNKGAKRPVVGVLEIGHSKIPMTLKELEKLRETITDAMYTTDMAYRLGQLK